MEGGTRRIVSFVWKLIRKIQKIGNMKNRITSVIAMPRSAFSRGLLCSIGGSSGLAALFFAQLEPVLDEDVRQEIGDGPQDHQQRRRPAHVGGLEEVQVGLDL